MDWKKGFRIWTGILAICIMPLAPMNASGDENATEAAEISDDLARELIVETMNQQNQSWPSIQSEFQAYGYSPNLDQESSNSLEVPQAEYLVCLIGHIAFGANARYGKCLSFKGKIYTITGWGIGLVIGAKASLLGGLATSLDDNIKDEYNLISLAKAGDKVPGTIHQSPHILVQLPKPGWGFDLMYGRSSAGRQLILIGASFGSLFDMSEQKLSIR